MSDVNTEVQGEEDPSAIRIVMNNLPSGTYYIRITSTALTDQPYALRVVTPDEEDLDPIIPGFSAINYPDDPYEPDDNNPDRIQNQIDIGNNNYVNRYFDIAGDKTDYNVDTVDWLKLELPEL